MEKFFHGENDKFILKFYILTFSYNVSAIEYL